MGLEGGLARLSHAVDPGGYDRVPVHDLGAVRGDRSALRRVIASDDQDGSGVGVERVGLAEDVYPTLHEERDRIHRRTVDVDLEVDVRAEGVAGVA